MPTPRPRVLIVPEWYPSPDRPGRAPWAREHVRAISPHVEAAQLVADPTPPRQGLTISEVEEDGLRVLRIGYPDLGSYEASYPGRLLGLRLAQARLEASGFVPDLFHARIFYSGFASLLLARRHDVPVIVSEHFTAFPRGLVTGVGRWMAKTTFERAALVCPDAADLGGHIQALGIRGRFRVMPNTVDTDVFVPRPPSDPKPDRPLTLLNVASLDPKKGQADLLEALAAARAAGADLKLRVVGDGDLRQELERKTAELQLQEHVTFLGARPKDEVAAEMRSADVLALPSHYENAPLVVSEALCSGLPVVATTVGDVADMVGPGDGIVVAPGDVPALTQALQAVAAELPRPDTDRARARWGKGPVGEQWVAIYEEEIARRRARRSRSR